MALASILVVDDDAAFRDVICRILRAGGHLVEQAPDGVRALHILKQQRQDVLITDIIMPDGDGIELIAAVRRTCSDVKILAVSGRGHLGALDLLDLAAKLGAHATLAKPFSADQLMDKLAGLGAMGGRRGQA